jgi:SSS family solute:Na+ symporter
MSPGTSALSIILAIVVGGSAIGFLAGRRRVKSLEQWTVAGRGFGSLLMWLLMAGEVYTTFAFLGASGWAYSRGGPTLYILAYLPLAFVFSFFLLPPIWELGRAHGLQTQPDFFLQRYGSKYLTALVAGLGVVFIIPYLQLQLTGLGIVVGVASFEAIPRPAAMTLALLLIAGFVLTSGVRAVAWVSLLKDLLMLVAAVTIGLGVPYAHFGGVGPMFAQLARAHPTHLTMPGATSTLTHSWYVSTVLVVSLSGFMWPHVFGASFTAKSGDTLRRNAVFMPIYQLTLAFIFFAGCSAVLLVPGLPSGDLSMLTVVRQTFPAWVLGVIGGAGALTAMVPSAILLLTASTLLAKNLWRPLIAPDMSDDQVAKLARYVVIALSLISLGLALQSSSTLVSLLLLGYAGVSQFLPGVALGLWWKKARAAGIGAGLLAGVGCTALLTLTHRDPFHGLSAGFLALCVNLLVAVPTCAWIALREGAPAALESHESHESQEAL